jgi:hypothetical protein
MEKTAVLSEDIDEKIFKEALYRLIEGVVREANEMGLQGQMVLDVVFDDGEDGLDITLEYDDTPESEEEK